VHLPVLAWDATDVELAAAQALAVLEFVD